MRKPSSIADQRRAVAAHKRRVIVTGHTVRPGSETVTRVLIRDVYYDVRELALQQLMSGKAPRQVGIEPSPDQSD